jgi:hypothetical protein
VRSVLAIALALALAGCKRSSHARDDASTTDTAAAVAAAAAADAAADAAAGPDVSYDDLGQLDPSFLNGVAIDERKAVDAVALGATLDVRVVARLSGPADQMPPLELLLILSGTRTIAVEFGGTWSDGLEEGLPAGTLMSLGAEETRQPWSDEVHNSWNTTTRLRSRGPVLFQFAFQSPHLLDSFVIVRERDTLVVYAFTTDSGYSSDDWEKLATIKLAKGATLRFP